MMISTSTPKSSSRPRISTTLPARILRGRRPVGDFYVDDYAFEIGPFGAAGGFFAEHAVD